jgi:hypothetical protein
LHYLVENLKREVEKTLKCKRWIRTKGCNKEYFHLSNANFLRNQLDFGYMGWIFFKNREVTKESSCFTLVDKFCWKRKTLCIKVFLKSTFLLLNFVFEMCMSIHCISYSCCHSCLLQSCFLIDIQFFWVLDMQFWKLCKCQFKIKSHFERFDQIKYYHLLEMKHKNKKIVTQMMEEEMQTCHNIITFLATTSLTKNVPMKDFFPTTC